MLLEDRDFIRMRDLMYSNFGINLAHKQKLIETRLNAKIKKKDGER